VPITLTQLASFLAVVRTGSVTAAAEELVVTQPSVSAALSALSKEVGVELTERHARSVRPSAAGRAFVPYAADVMGLLERGTRAAREAAGAADAEVRVVSTTTAGELLVPALIQAFHARNPGVRVTLDVVDGERVRELLMTHAADVGVDARAGNGRLRGVPLMSDELVLVDAPGSPMATRRSISLRELGARTWLLREEGAATRADADELLARHELRPDVLTFASNQALKAAVRAGLGIGLQPRASIGAELASGALLRLPVSEPLPSREWYLLTPAAAPVREPIERFLQWAMSAEGGAVMRAGFGLGRPPALAVLSPASLDGSDGADHAAMVSQ